jgi:hypothetical protein
LHLNHADLHVVGIRIKSVGSPHADEFHVIGEPGSGRFAVLYRQDNHLAGAFTVGLPVLLIRARRAINKRLLWVDAGVLAKDVIANQPDESSKYR